MRIATYNVRNYLEKDRQIEGRWLPGYPKPEHEKAVVREVILSANPDILVLQEMGPLPFLKELRRDLKAMGLHYAYMIHLRGPDPDRHLAVLSRIEPAEVVKHRDLDFKYLDRREQVKRGLLELRFEDGEGGSFKLFAVHLKSHFTEDREDPGSRMRRTREAQACRDRIIEQTFEKGLKDFLVAGDFNDHPASSTLRRFYQRGSLKIGDLIPAADRQGAVWTYFYKKEARYSLVDGFVASRAIQTAIREGRGHIIGGLEVLAGSDHRLVYLDLAFGQE